jgi:histidyl-tRNA synthetase
VNNTNVPIANVRGTADILPAECAVRRQITDTLCRTIESFGYQRIDVPVIEHTELFLTKSGEDIISKMYSFPVKNRSICLRPEFTASVGRAFVNHLQDRPLPLRLYYAGPVFRYEKPQRGRYRQFNQVGVELIGAPSPWADAEIVRCACDGMETLGLTNYQVVIGHIGVVTELLRVFELDRQAHMFLIQNMENLWKDGKGVEHVKARLREVYPDFDQESGWSALSEAVSAGGAEVDSDVLELFGEMGEEGARSFLRDFLARMEIGIGLGNREPEEVVDRLLRKIGHRDMSATISQAIDFLSQLSQLAGPPVVALNGVKDLLAQHDGAVDRGHERLRH